MVGTLGKLSCLFAPWAASSRWGPGRW